MSQKWKCLSNNSLEQWLKPCPSLAKRRLQSPIDIKLKNINQNSSVNGIRIAYGNTKNALVKNTGYTLEISIADPHGMTITGGPLACALYKFKQLHFHWGKDCENGSEHYLNGESFDAELHVVHWNQSMFFSFEEALHSGKSDALCVLGVFLREKLVENIPNEKIVRTWKRFVYHCLQNVYHYQNVFFTVQRSCKISTFYHFDSRALKKEIMAEESNESTCSAINKICASANYVQKSQSETILSLSFNIQNLVPAKSEYFVYDGSLTTIPFTECVKWIVFCKAIKVSKEALRCLRKLQMDSNETLIENNCRVLQPLNDRIIMKSTRPFELLNTR